MLRKVLLVSDNRVACADDYLIHPQRIISLQVSTSQSKHPLEYIDAKDRYAFH